MESSMGLFLFLFTGFTALAIISVVMDRLHRWASK